MTLSVLGLFTKRKTKVYFEFEKVGDYLHFVLFKGEDKYCDTLMESALSKKEAKKLLETLQDAVVDLEFFLKNIKGE